MLKSFLAAVLLFASVKRCFVSRMRDFCIIFQTITMMCSEKKKPEIRLSKEQQRWISEVDNSILYGTPPLDRIHSFVIHRFTLL